MHQPQLDLINLCGLRYINLSPMSLKQTTLKTLGFLGAATKQGQLLSGVQKGPQLIRQSGVFKQLQNNHSVSVKDYGDIYTLEEQRTKYPPVVFPVRNLNVLGPVLGRLHNRVYDIVQSKETDLLLTVGGDHSIASATISAVKRYYNNLKVVWVDAHPDCTNSHIRNPHLMFSQNYHGMPLSLLTGITDIPELDFWSWFTSQPLLDPKNVVLIAIRDIDRDQFISLRKHNVKCFTMDHVDKYGIGNVLTQTIQYLDPKNQHPFHLSFDVDAIDPEIVTQTGTKFRYGLSGRESVHIVRRLAHQRKLVSMDLVQINQQKNPQEATRPSFRGQNDLAPLSNTLGVSADLITSLCTQYFTL